MTLSEAYRKGTGILKVAGIDAPAADAGVILCHVVKCNRAYLYAHGDEELADGLLRTYISLLKKRTLGYPLQYLTGAQEFMSLPFEVGPGVLIPRQDTELLVETVTDFCREKAESKDNDSDYGDGVSGCELRILDIGTGSGCIAISLAHYLPGSRVVAVDKMAEALEIAKRNARLNGVEDRVLFIQSDLFDNLRDDLFDVIVSNPPYIRSGDIKRLQQEVKDYEPIEALDGGNDGLFFYREIIRRAPVYLKDGGMLAFETGYDQAGAVARQMTSSSCFDSIRIHKDLAGIDRVVSGLYSGS
jgi:release factor glutamine methyltransferase